MGSRAQRSCCMSASALQLTWPCPCCHKAAKKGAVEDSWKLRARGIALSRPQRLPDGEESFNKQALVPRSFHAAKRRSVYILGILQLNMPLPRDVVEDVLVLGRLLNGRRVVVVLGLPLLLHVHGLPNPLLDDRLLAILVGPRNLVDEDCRGDRANSDPEATLNRKAALASVQSISPPVQALGETKTAS